MHREDRKRVTEHLDMIAKLRARAAEAHALGLHDIAAGAEEDIQRRAKEITRLRNS